MSIRPTPPYFDNLADNDGKASKLWLNYFQSLGGSSGGGGVNSVSGVSGEIAITGTATDPIVGISASYHGSSNLTHLGTVTTGIWHGSPIDDAYISSAATWNAKMTNPMSAIGDLILGGASGAPGRLGIGANAYVLTSDGTTASWQPSPTGTSGANPTASIGLTAVNGSALTFMRSDAAPAISQAISPTWSGTHTFSNTIAGAISGNAGTATALQTARAINGVNFDGTAPITVTAAAGTLTGATLASNVLASSLTSVGTLAALTVTATITGSVSGNAATVTTNANLTGPITSAGNATSIASQTGTGSTFAMSAGPTFTGTLAGAIANFSGQIQSTQSNYGINSAFLAQATTYASYAWKETGAAADNRVWHAIATSEQFRLSAVNDANNASTDFFVVDRTGTTVDSITYAGTQIISSLTASSSVATDAFKGLISITNTGTGNNVLSISPTLTGTIGAAAATLTGQLKDTQSGYGSTAGFLASATTYASYALQETGASSDNKMWNIIANGEQFRIGALNDANNAGTDFMVVDRTGITIDTITFPPVVEHGDDVKLKTAGKGFYVKEGSNATMGTATLVLGVATVSTTKVTASSRIFLSVESLGTIASPVAVSVTGRSAGTSFNITSANLTDTSVIAWLIIEPA